MVSSSLSEPGAYNTHGATQLPRVQSEIHVCYGSSSLCSHRCLVYSSPFDFTLTDSFNFQTLDPADVADSSHIILGGLADMQFFKTTHTCQGVCEKSMTFLSSPKLYCLSIYLDMHIVQKRYVKSC